MIPTKRTGVTARNFRNRASLTFGLIAAALMMGQRVTANTYDFQRIKLDNGLTVVSLEDHSTPIVAVQVWYAVGSKDENPERQGFAHMFEHMMFRGTDVLGPEEHFEFIRRTGGDCNAFTAFDNTTYVNTLPSNQLELALWLEADRMAFLKIDDESFYKERSVVEEERRLRSLNTPYGTVPEKLLPALFKEHPYRWTPIGQIPHLRAATIDELQQFWDRYYTPSNATLVVVGDVTHAKVQELAKKYFGWIPTIPEPQHVTIKEPRQTEPRSITIPEKKGPIPIIGYMYRGVPQAHADALPLEMLMTILGGGESSRLYKDLVKDQQVAQFAVAGAFSLQDDGICGAGAALMPWGNKQKVFEAITAHIDRIRSEPVTERELEKVRNQFLSQEVMQSMTVESKAMRLGTSQVLEGGAEVANRRMEQIRSVTADDLLRVARTYLAPEHMTTVVVQPETGGILKSLLGMKGSDVDEGAQPLPPPTENRVATRGGLRADLKRPEWFPKQPPSAPLLEAIPEVNTVERTLPSGLRIVVVPNHEVPFVSMTLGLLHGGWADTKPGIASMTTEMLTKGTEKMSAAELAEELEFNAISLGGAASIDVGSVFASCTRDKFETAARLMGDVVRTPTFPASELEIARQQTLMGLMIESKTPEYAADRELRKRLWGDHPYARTSTGEPEDVQSIKADELKKWWTTFARPDSAVLYIAGDVEPEAALKIAEQNFAEWKSEGPKPSPTIAAPPEEKPTQIYLVDRPGSVQSQIRVGQRGVTRQDKDYFTGAVLSQIFGGSFSSRLNKAIRVDKGLTYGARGGLSSNRFGGAFNCSTFTKTPSTAETVGVILREIDRMRASPPEASEVDTARNYLLGAFAGDRETPGQVVGDLWLIEYAGLPKDYLTNYLNGVKKTTAEDLHRVSNRLMRPENLAIVVVGEASAIKDDLAKIAPVTVIQGEENAPAPEGETLKPPA